VSKTFNNKLQTNPRQRLTCNAQQGKNVKETAETSWKAAGEACLVSVVGIGNLRDHHVCFENLDNNVVCRSRVDFVPDGILNATSKSTRLDFGRIL
jgi:hypothetical protein